MQGWTQSASHSDSLVNVRELTGYPDFGYYYISSGKQNKEESMSYRRLLIKVSIRRHNATPKSYRRE
jgi:hypothetical protein